ncbi:MAG: hypothetical protein HXY36_00380 [Chloroflexi bacterium]|nr:hypothetical protein [Chloroflexota bacterium]
MKRTTGIVVVLLLATALLPACHGTPSGYTGFMAPAEGQWAEYVLSNNGEEYHQRMECIGQDTVDGKTCTGFEITMSEQEEMIMQIWSDTATGEVVKYVVKMGDQVMCMNVGQSPEPPETETPSEYDPNLPDISYGTYTTPTVKTVNVAKFTTQSEVWVSSQVPFGMVKVIDDNGETTMYLYDFGLTGAHRDISKTEMENCIPMGG